MTDIDEMIRRLERIATDAPTDDDGASTVVCSECGSESRAEDRDFRVDDWAICPCCLLPITVTWICDEGHAHTEFFEPDFDTPEGRDDALLAVRDALAMLPESEVADEERGDFELRLREMERHLLDKIN